MSILHKLEWRYATKKFDSNKEVSESDITNILKATNLSASSSGLQPYSLIVIHNEEIKKQLREHSYNQPQITDASHIMVFAAKTEVSEEYISEYIERTEQIRNLTVGDLDGFKQNIIARVAHKSKQEISHWTQKQAYIALGTLLLAAADLKIDVCPMEGFIPEKYNEILGLNEQNLHACVIAAVGYRAHDDKLAYAKKSRKALDELVQLKY